MFALALNIVRPSLLQSLIYSIEQGNSLAALRSHNFGVLQYSRLNLLLGLWDLVITSSLSLSVTHILKTSKPAEKGRDRKGYSFL